MKLISKLRSKAKINLFLHVNKRLDNGYHELESLFYFPNFFDVIEVYESDKAGLEVTGRYAEKLEGHPVQDNLIILVYNSLKAAFPEKIPELHFKLEKNIPVSAGLGGGSGNAAAILRYLNEYYKLGIGEMQMIEIAKKVGADVPPSLFEKPCLVSGIGEKIDFNIKIPELEILLVNSGVPVSTKQVFNMGFSSLKSKLNNVQYVFENQSELAQFLNSKTTNSLYENAVTISPEIADIQNKVSKLEGCLLARMSGSGGTVFGIFKDQSSVKKAVLELKKNLSESYFIESEVKD